MLRPWPTLLLITFVTTGGGTLYYVQDLLGKFQLLQQQNIELKRKHQKLEQRLKKQKQALEKSRQRLKETENKLEKSRKRVSRLEAEQPKGARKLAKGASKIPVVGSIASVGLMAADAVEAAEDCYQNQEQCKEKIENSYDSVKESTGRGTRDASAWFSEKAEAVRRYFSEEDSAVAGAR